MNMFTVSLYDAFATVLQFDISGLKGKAIDSATLQFALKTDTSLEMAR